MYDGKRTAALNMPGQLRVDPELKKRIEELATAGDREPREQILHLVKLGIAVAMRLPPTAPIEEPVPLEEIDQRRFLVSLNEEQVQFVRTEAEQDFRNCADQIRWIVELAMRAGRVAKVPGTPSGPIPVPSEPRARRNGRAL